MSMKPQKSKISKIGHIFGHDEKGTVGAHGCDGGHHGGQYGSAFPRGNKKLRK